MNISIIGMPLFYGCDKPGVEKGPEELRKNNLIDIFEKNHNVYDLGDIEVEKVSEKEKYKGDLKLKYLTQVVNANNGLASKVLEALENDTFPFIVGGDHSLALGSLAGASKYFGDDLAVIWIDAHGDINTDKTSPSGNIHGMPLAASMGYGYEKLTSIFFDKAKIKSENVFILACRDLDKGEVDLINELNMHVWTNEQINNLGTKEVLNQLLSLIKEKNIKFIQPFFSLADKKVLIKRVQEEFKEFNVTASEAEVAVNAAFDEREKFDEDLRAKGKEVLEYLERTGKKGIVLAGRPYHIDPEVNHGIPDIITSFDMAVLTEDSISHLGKLDTKLRVVDQWMYHSRLYRAAAFVAENKSLELIQLNSFGCGLDAVTTDQVSEILASKGRIYTCLKIDEGTNDIPVDIVIPSEWV